MSHDSLHWLRCAALGLLAALAGGALPSANEGVTRVRVEGALDVGTQALLSRALRGARERGDLLLIELDTPGGEIELMWQLAGMLLDAADEGVGTVCWVHDRALSAGSLLAMACERLYMRSHATIGSALPVQIGPGGLMPTSEDAAVREKLSSALRAEFRGVAEKRGRPALLAEAMVDPEVEVVEVRLEGELRLVTDVELDDLRARGDEAEFVRTVCPRGALFNATGREAVELGLADGLAESLDEVLGKVGLGPVVATEVQRTRSEDLAGWLNALTPLLLIAGFVLAWLELKVPGFGLPGILSLACFAVLLFGRYLVGLADVPHLVLITLGAALFALELFVVPGTLWVGALGALLLVGGLVWSFAGSHTGFAYPLDRKILFDESFRVLASGFVALLLMWGLSRILPRTPVLSHLVLEAPTRRAVEARTTVQPGARGRTATRLRPTGKVVLDDEPLRDFEASSEGGEIPPDTPVRVVEVHRDGRLVVATDEEVA